jgi:hypothetical protein
MGDLSGRNFGLLIAYVLPGFVALWGLSYSSDAIRLWLQGTAASAPSVGGALYVVLASVACGMTANAVRWATIDQLHHLTGLDHPDWDDSRLQERLEAFDYLVENHFRYYQFYSSTVVSVLVAYAAWRHSGQSDASGGAEFGVSLLAGVFLASSRDALRRYYSGTSLLLGTITKEPTDDERTASHHEPGGNSEVSESPGESPGASAGIAGRGEHAERVDAGGGGSNNSEAPEKRGCQSHVRATRGS